jgi:tetratricopeptide (TPR) repeat protein
LTPGSCDVTIDPEDEVFEMATAKIGKKEMAQDEFLETVFDLGEWLEVHWRKVAIGLGIGVALVLAVIGWNSMRESATEDANALLASGIDAFAPTAAAGGQPPAPRYADALALFDKAAERSGSGGVGAIARLFRARTLIAMSRASEAVPVLEELSKGRNEGIAAAAKVSLAEALEATGNADRAATLLQEVSSPSSPKAAAYPADAVLLMLAELRDRQGRHDDAKKVYDDLIARFPQSPFAADARQATGQPAAKAN